MGRLDLRRRIVRSALTALLIGTPSLTFASLSFSFYHSGKLSPAQQIDPVFDAATIKVSDSGAPTMQKLNQEGRHFSTVNASLGDLIVFAYDVQVKQIVDPSGLTAKDRYDISAVSNQDGTPTVHQVRVMLQKLLTDRYGLSFHKDKRELSAFVLTTTKNEPRLKPTHTTGPVPVSDVQSASNGWTLSMRNASTTDFTRFLQTIVLDRPVVDSTGLSGKFDISVTFTPYEGQFHGHPPPARSAEDGDMAPGLFDATKEQLGLRLEPRKVLVDVMVIDHIDPLSAN